MQSLRRYWQWSFGIGEVIGVVYAAAAEADGAWGNTSGAGGLFLFAFLWTLACGVVSGWVALILLVLRAIRAGFSRTRRFANPS